MTENNQTPFYMEDHLDAPLRQLLEVMQGRIMTHSTYFGIPTFKCPTDYWVYQELIFQLKPDVILEIGNHKGGSALALAHLCDLMGKGRIIALDLSQTNIFPIVRNHERILLIEGDARRSYDKVKAAIQPGERVLIIEDSSHRYDDTLHIMRTFSTLLKPGDYFIVEDGITHHGLPGGSDLGPYAAIELFLQENKDFELDRTRESFGVTWNPKGYLRRVGSQSQTTRPEDHSALTAENFKRIAKLFIPPILLKVFRALRG